MRYCRLKASGVAFVLFVSGGAFAQDPVATTFYTLTPCRVVDTRGANGALGGPALVAGGTRDFQVVGTCGVPAAARSVVLNVTVTGSSASGGLTIFPSGIAQPNTSAINWQAGQTRANNMIAGLGGNGALSVFCSSAGNVNFIMDVSGYFTDLSTFQLFANAGSFGATPSLVAHIQSVGIDAWVTEQLAAPISGYTGLPPQPNTIPGTCTGTCQRDNYTMYPLQRQFFLNALYGPDQLRQRVAWALHKFLVISGTDIVQPSRMVPYLNILVNYSFANYRDILYYLTLNPAMGQYLNMNTSTLLNPNENYAREVMQLFSIGLFMLNNDGTLQLDINNQPIPTYNQATVTEFARVFTGWQLKPPFTAGIDDYLEPMVFNNANHDKGSKSLLNGATIPARVTGGDQDVSDAIDNIFNHPNVGPYVATQLIHSLVTSNPSPAYVGRVAAKFNNNGSGVRGDLAAVVRAILTDPDLISSWADPNFGSLRDPVLFATGFLRALGARSADGTQNSDGVLAPQVQNLGQILFQPDTVFSYYPADYEVPGTSLSGPEFGVLSAITAFRRANFVNTIVYSTIPVGTNNPLGTSLDLTAITALAGDPNAMVEALNQRLCRGLLSPGEKAAIVTAVNAIPATSAKLRAQQATYLVATSSQFQVER
jgi:hypothetical protein